MADFGVGDAVCFEVDGVILSGNICRLGANDTYYYVYVGTQLWSVEALFLRRPKTNMEVAAEEYEDILRAQESMDG